MTVATTALHVLAAAAETEHHGNVQAETMIFGVIALVLFLLLGLVTVSFRNVANRHSHKAEAYAATHAHELAQNGHGHH